MSTTIPIGEYIAEQLRQGKKLRQDVLDAGKFAMLHGPLAGVAAFGGMQGTRAAEDVGGLNILGPTTLTDVPGSPIPNVTFGQKPARPLGDPFKRPTPPPMLDPQTPEMLKANQEAFPFIPAGEPVAAGAQEAPSVPGVVRRGPNGEILLTNLPGVGKELEYNDPGYLPPMPMDLSSSNSGQAVRLNVGRMSPNGQRVAGGFSPGAPDPTEQTWAEVDAKNYSPLQEQHWIENQTRGLPVDAAKTENRKGLAEAATEEAKPGLMGAQGESFRGEGALRQAQAEDVRNPLRDTSIETENFIRANPAVYQERLLPIARELVRQSFIARKLIPPNGEIPKGMLTPPLLEQFMGEAINKYMTDRDRSYQRALARNAMMPQQPYQP